MRYCHNINFKEIPSEKDENWIGVSHENLPIINEENVNHRALVMRKRKAAHAGPLIWETWLANIRMNLDNIGYYHKHTKHINEI